MSGHCPKCGTYHEEDDDRVCCKCNDIDRLTRENAELRARLDGTRMFPLQSSYSKTTPHPTKIPWAVADKAYSVYRAKYGAQQTLERLAERGGFSAGEMDDFYPGWREEVALVTDLRAKLAAAEKARDEAEWGRDILKAEVRAWRGEMGCIDDAPELFAAKCATDLSGVLNPTAAAAVKEAGGG